MGTTSNEAADLEKGGGNGDSGESIHRSPSSNSSRPEKHERLTPLYAPDSMIAPPDDDDDDDRISRAPSTRLGQDSVLGKTLSIVRTKDSGKDPGPPPDGGFEAWLQCALVHLVIFNTWGYINCFGVFQTFYTDFLDRSPSDISWIGSIQIFLLYVIGTFSGRATDAGFFKAVWSVGAVIVVFGIFMASLCTEYWQLFLAQGLCVGIGAGLVFCPSVALVSTYFSSRRSTALAIAVSGSATGGLIFPVVFQHLIPSIGFGWTMRALGLINLVAFAPGFVFLKPRLPPRRSGPFFEWAAFKEAPYCLFAVGMFLAFWGLYVAFFYIGSFGRDTLGISQPDSINLILIMNAAGIPGRVIPSTIADFFCGPFNALIPAAGITAVVIFGWIGVKDMSGLYAFAVLYGFFVAGVQSLFPAASGAMTTDLKKTGIRFGMLLSIMSIASLTGSPIAGALIQKGNGDYLYAQLFAALCLIIGCAVLMAARYKIAGSALRVRV